MTQDATTTPADDGAQFGVPDGASGKGLLDGLDDVPLSEHVARFEAVHEELRERLSGGGA